MVSVGEIPSFNMLGKCNRPEFSFGRKYIIDILNCHFSYAVAISFMKHRTASKSVLV